MFTTSDSFILRSAGLDALVLQKSFAFGVQLFLPIAVLSCVIRELLCFGSAGCCSLCACGAARRALETRRRRCGGCARRRAAPSKTHFAQTIQKQKVLPINAAAPPFIPNVESFARVTMANLQPQSSVMWCALSLCFVLLCRVLCVVRATSALANNTKTQNKQTNKKQKRVHFFLVFAFLGWTFLLIEWHYRQYVALRQHYLKGGDDPNYWRGSLRVCLRVC